METDPAKRAVHAGHTDRLFVALLIFASMTGVMWAVTYLMRPR